MAIAAIRTVIIYIVLIAAMRVMGRRQLGELQPIELVVTLLISDLASVPMQESGIPLLNGIVPILILVSAEILLSVLMLKSSRFSSLISGKPIVLIRDGKPDQKMLKKLRITIEDLMESLRKQGVFHIDDVQVAIAETNGSVSIYPTAQKRPVTAEDLSLPPTGNHGVPLVVVADGVFCDWAIRTCGVTEKWIDRTICQNGYAREEVMIMIATAEKKYTIIPKEKDL